MQNAKPFKQLIIILMRAGLLPLLLLFILCGTAYADHAEGQQLLDKKIKVQVEGAELKTVLSKLSQIADVKFVYSAQKIPLQAIVTLDAKDERLEEVLDKLLSPLLIDYKVTGNQVVLMNKNAEKTAENKQKIAAAAEFLLNAANVNNVKGRVTDEKGNPVQAASVMVKGTTRGVTTNENGVFIIKADAGETLEVTAIGYQLNTVTVTASASDLAVILKAAESSLNEVVVVGYGTQKKANVTGAVNTVKMKDVVGDRPVTSVSQALQGVVPGLQVTYGSGEPGARTDVNIRGMTSINGGSPLILVDNVPVQDLSLVNPNDIETVSVLKDAASASIYGGRTAYGVVLITTKKPTGDRKTRVEYSNNFAISQATDIPKNATPLQTLQMFKDAGGITYWGEAQDLDKWIGYLQDYNKNPSLYPNGVVMDNSKHYWLKQNDEAKDLFRTGFAQTHNVAMSGGSAKNSYRLALGTTNSDGILAGNKDGYKRYNVTSFVNSDITKWLTAQLNFGYTNSMKTFPITSYPAGIFGNIANIPSFAPIGFDSANNRPFATPKNFTDLASTSNAKLNDTRATGRIILKPITGLTITGEYTFDRLTSDSTAFDKKFLVTDISTYLPATSIANSVFTKANSFTNYNAVNLFANYEKRLGDHNLGVMVGYNQEFSHTELFYSQMTSMINDNLPSLSQGTGAIKSQDFYTEYAVRGWFGRINYAYKNKYLLEANGRYDGSSKFPPNHKYGFFPSFSAGWRVSEENFMQALKPVLSELKLRGSWGEIGNQATSNNSTYPYFPNNYPYVPQMSAVYSNWVDNNAVYTTLTTPALVSSNFTWETVRTLNLGVNVGLFNNKLLGSFDAYQRQTLGMLAPGAALPSVLGTTAPRQNAANLTTKGWELEASWRDKIGKVSYSIGFNLYDTKAQITSYNNPTKLLQDKDGGYLNYAGQQIGEIWGYTTSRYYTENDFVAGTLDATGKNGTLKANVPFVNGYPKPNPGDVLYVDRDGNDTIKTNTNTANDPGDRRIIGNTTRRLQFGINGTVAWKGFDFSFFVQGIGKRDLWLNNSLIFPYANGRFSNIFASQTDYWMPNRPNAYFARLYDEGLGNTGANRMTQTKYLVNGAYWRLKNVTMGYTLPSALLKRVHLEKLRLFVSGENLFTRKHVPAGVDPESTDKGYGVGYPFMKMYSFGANLTF